MKQSSRSSWPYPISPWLLAGAFFLVSAIPVLVTPGPLSASSIPTAPPEEIDITFDNAVDIVTADWDGDGDLDILAAGKDENRIKLYRNQDFGWLDSTFTVFGSMNALAVGDIDRDGTDDLFYGLGEAGSGAVGVILNRSSNLTVPIANSGLNNPNCAALGDLDKDGDLDAVTCEFNSGEITWFENTDGLGETWSTHLALGLSQAPADAVTHDVDLDGDLDLVVITFSDLIWIENRLDQTSGAAWIRHVVDASVPAGWTVTVGDVNGDGLAEIVGGAVNTALLAWWQRPATVTNAWSRQTVQSSWGVADVQVADADQDGDLDILASRWMNSSGDLRYFENTGGAAAFNELDLGGDYDLLRGFTVADIDGDGAPDFPLAAGNSDTVALIENRTVRSTAVLGSRTTQTPTNTPNALGLTDLDRDGDLDIVSYDSDQRLRYRDAIDDSGQSIQATSATLNSNRGFHLVDIDLDSDIDVVMSLDQGVEWLENLGFGSQYARHTIDSASTFQDLLVFDFTRNGLPDVVGWDPASGRVRWWRNVDGGSSWLENPLASSITTLEAMAYGDLDGDSQPEVILAKDDEVRAYFRIADIAFTTTLISNAKAEEIATGDFDADGDVDVLGFLPDSGNALFARWENDGSAMGWQEKTFEAPGGVNGLEIIDFDLDGDLDAVASNDGDDVAIFYDPGDDTNARIEVGNSTTEFLKLGRVTDDAFPDIVAIHSGGSFALIPSLHGQFGIEIPTASSPATELDTAIQTPVILFDLEIEHLGRPGDQDVVFRQLQFTFTAINGDPLSDAVLDTLFTQLDIQRANAHGGSPSTLVVIDEANITNPLTFSIPPSGGEENTSPPQDEQAPSIGAFSVRASIKAEAASLIDAFRIQLDAGGSGIQTEDESAISLEIFPGSPVTLPYVIVDAQPIFIDDFETGDTTEWTLTQP